MKDSIIELFQPDPAIVITYTYSDTLRPFFMVDNSGLMEFPEKSEYLILKMVMYSHYMGEDPEPDGFRLKHRYEIIDNGIKDMIYTYSLNSGIIIAYEEVNYLLIENDKR